MVYVQNRLFWIDEDARIVYASDLQDPLSMQEAIDTNIFGFVPPDETGDLIALAPLNEPMLPEDAAADKRAGGGWNMVASLSQNGPRRMGVDPNGDYLYSGYYWSGKVARTHIRTREMKEYDLPDGRYIHPYKIVVDRNHMAYITAANGDVFFKFNPETEQFTRYPLPTRGSNSRHMIVDNSGDRPVLWIPYTGAQKIAKVEFRTDPSR